MYDFHDDILYWSNFDSKKIVKLKIERGKSVKLTEEIFLEANSKVAGLEIDTCNRNLYFTTYSYSDNPTLNVVPINNVTKVKAFGIGNHNAPVAISLDHQKRRLYVADRHSTSYSIDSYDSMGEDFRTETKSSDKSPRSIAVDDTFVYFVEADWHHLMKFKKEGNGLKNAEEMFSLKFDPTDIIVRKNFIIDHEGNCNLSPSRMDQIKKEVKQSTTTKQLSNPCLHGGNLDDKSSLCICKENFDGDFCEINLCYHFCLNDGECAVEKDLKSQKLKPHCSCKKGFEGDRCEVDVCNNFCLNNGKCLITSSRKPVCECVDEFSGSRCEILKSKEVEVITTTMQEKVTLTPPMEFPYEKSFEQIQTPISCKEDKTKDRRTLIYLIIMGIIACVLFVFIIIGSVFLWRGKSIPSQRPHKKYIFHKKIDNSTYRPTTEQCEVIIEDCCNMNICETVS